MSVTATTTRVWQRDGTVLGPAPVTVRLDATGTGRVTVPATDQLGFVDADGAPASWGYRVVVALEGADPVERVVDLPAGTHDGRVVRVVLVPPPARAVPRPVRTAPAGTEPRHPELRVGRRRLLGALALSVPAAVLASRSAAGATPPTHPVGGSVRTAPLPLATHLDDDVVVGSEARPRTLRIVSSGTGGTAPGPAYRDSTGRLLLESHQPHFGSYGETVRVALKHPRAKGMIAYLGTGTRPTTAAATTHGSRPSRATP